LYISGDAQAVSEMMTANRIPLFSIFTPLFIRMTSSFSLTVKSHYAPASSK
jgi:hypothetical protein